MATQFNQFDASAIGEIDQSTVHVDGVLYPTIQWVYGNPAHKKMGGMDYQGGFFINEESCPNPNAFLEAGWEAVEWVHQDGSSTQGYWARDLEVSVINYRQRWEVQLDDGKRAAFSWDDYDKATAIGNATGRLHALIIVKGLEGEGQFVLTFRGVGAKAFYARNNIDAVLNQFQRTVIAAANKVSDEQARKNARTTGLRWPYRAFWLPIGPARTDKGEPVFVKAGSTTDAKSVVLPIAVGLPAKPVDVTGEVLGNYYIGNDMLKVVNEYYTQAEAQWSHAWDSLEPGVEPYKAESRLPDAETIAEEGI